MFATRAVPMSSRWFAIMLGVGVGGSGCESATGPVDVGIEATTATTLVGTVGSEIAPAPTVRATDASGRALEGVAIEFEVEPGGGSVAHSTVETDATGSATAGPWLLGSTIGTYALTVRSAGEVHVTFTAVARAGPVEKLTPLDGNNQLARVNEPLPRRLLVRADDGFGNPVLGASVSFTVISGDGMIDDQSVLTDSEGTGRSGAWTLGPAVGVQQVRAESGAAQVVFSAMAYQTHPGLEGRLSFVSSRDGHAQIYVMNADGTGLERLTTSPTDDWSPAWSPDGTQIAFVSRRDGDAAIYVMSADGSNITRLTDAAPPQEWDPAWSPTGSHIAFSTMSDGSSSLATIDVTNRTVALLPGSPGYEGEPSWSPDGLQLAFVSDRNAYDFVLDIFTMKADGTDQRSRTQGFATWPDRSQNIHPAWSPDGSMIAFVYSRVLHLDKVRWQVAVMSADGQFLKDLAWAGDTTWLSLSDPGSLAWSPDGRGIAYSALACDLPEESGCSKSVSVEYVSLDGSERGTLVSNASSPSWRR